MPPIPTPETPRLVLYHQTHHDRSGKSISALPLLACGVTHVYIAAIHLNDGPENITLNDHPAEHVRNTQLWAEVKALQKNGVKVMGMLGGAAKGSYLKLQQDFDGYYAPLAMLLRSKRLDGLDLDIEEDVPLLLTRRLLRRLRDDFGTEFILTLAPVMPALLPRKPHLVSFTYRLLHPELPAAPDIIRPFINANLLPSHNHMSGFNHFALESSEEGKLVSWYNVQFYCGWGDAGNARLYEALVACGWNPRKLVLGALTNAENGSGFVDDARLAGAVIELKRKYGDSFGGIMGWEWFNAGTGWVRNLAAALDLKIEDSAPQVGGAAIPDEAVNPSLSAPEDTADFQSAMEGANLLAPTQMEAILAQARATIQTPPPAESQALDAPSSASQIESVPNEANVQRLVEMGSDRAEAVAALDAMGGDVDAAAALLFGD